jgi:xanthine dehydrogenase accessory factor
MANEREIWNLIEARLRHGEPVMLLVVAESQGSSPGRAGYKMAVTSDGELAGSIGGGVMEVALVERARALLQTATDQTEIVEQVHRRDVPDSSGMICSGRQTVLIRRLTPDVLEVVRNIDADQDRNGKMLEITSGGLSVISHTPEASAVSFERGPESEITYRETIRTRRDLYIVGGGHCAMALSELASKVGFRITIFDDRPGLNTLAKNEFADEIRIIDSYEKIAEHVPQGIDVYVVVMTLGYASDAVVIRELIDHDVRYMGVLGSKAKMKVLLNDLADQGLDRDRLAGIRTPIGLAINSRTPEEIAVSIAAEMIAIKNG